MEKKTLALIIALVLIAGAIVYLQQFSPDRSFIGKPVVPGSRAAINTQKAQVYPVAKEIAKPSGFVNTGNITVGGLVGKEVILVDFWTYSCINCERTIPYLNLWYDRYQDKGLEIIGVHTPEFPFEHDIANVRKAVTKFGIRYPVVLDNDYATWDSYGNRYWPEDYLIDIDGFIVDRHIGEGDYDTTEQEIQSLLRERAGALNLSVAIPNTTGTPAGAIAVDFAKIGSPETYFGSGKNQFLGNGPQFTAGPQALTLPAAGEPDMLYLGGSWNFTDAYAETRGNASVRYRYNAKNVYFVASASGPTEVRVSLDGAPIGDSAGADVRNASVTVQDERLYTIVQGKDYGNHTLGLDIPLPGVRAYTFTFG